MSENKRTYEYSEELTTITGDELLHADLAGYTYAKRTKLSTVFNWIKTSLTGFFIRSINGTYPDANSNIALTYSDVGAGSAQAVADNTANILVLDEDLEDLSQDVVINTALSIDNEGRITVNETTNDTQDDRLDVIEAELTNLIPSNGTFYYDAITGSTNEQSLALTLTTQMSNTDIAYINDANDTLDILVVANYFNRINFIFNKSGGGTRTATYRIYNENDVLYFEEDIELAGSGTLTPSLTIDVKDRPIGEYYATLQLDSNSGTIELMGTTNVSIEATAVSLDGVYQKSVPSDELTTVTDSTKVQITGNEYSLLSTIKTYLTTAFNLLYVPLTRTINSKVLSANIELDADDVDAVPTGTTYNIANSYSIPSTTPSNSVFHFNGNVESTFTMPVHDTVDEEWFVTFVNHATTDVKLNIVSNITDVSLVDWTDYYIIPSETSKIRRNDNNEYIVMQCHDSNTVNGVALGVDGNYDVDTLSTTDRSKVDNLPDDTISELEGKYNRIAIVLNDSNDLDDIVETGLYRFSSSSLPLNYPTSGASGILEVSQYSGNYTFQVYTNLSGSSYWRYWNGYWRGWQLSITSDDFDTHVADVSDGAHSENNYTDSEKSTVDGNYSRSVTNQTDITALETDKLDVGSALLTRNNNTLISNDATAGYYYLGDISATTSSINIDISVKTGLSGTRFPEVITFKGSIGKGYDNTLSSQIEIVGDDLDDPFALIRTYEIDSNSFSVYLATFSYSYGNAEVKVNGVTGGYISQSDSAPSGTVLYDSKIDGATATLELKNLRVNNLISAPSLHTDANGLITAGVEKMDDTTVYSEEYSFPTGSASLSIALSGLDVEDGQSLSIKVTTPNAGLTSSVDWVLFTKISDTSAVINSTLISQVFTITISSSSVVVSKSTQAAVDTMILIEPFGGVIT